MTKQRLVMAAWLMGGLLLATAPDAGAGSTRLAQAAPAPQAAPAAVPAAPADPVGNVATLTGSATVTRNAAVTPLKPKDDIFKNDVVQTAANSALGITFNDDTTFNLTANARIAIDNFVYDEGGAKNAALFNIAKGTVAFVASAVAKTGDMTIATPTATLGIRGTTGLVEVPDNAAGAAASNVAIKLYPDADGKVGRIEVNDRAGARLGLLSQGATGFAIRPGAGARFAAVPLSISPQQAARDQGIVRRVHAAQTLGRRIVTQRRNAVRDNRNNPAARPGQRPNTAPRLNGQPGQPGSRAQPAPPAHPGSPAQPGSRSQPGSPAPQPAPPTRPGQQRPPGLQRQGAPALQRPAGQLRPAPIRRPAAVAPRPRGQNERR